jgi:predicted flavoprotein YhiN
MARLESQARASLQSVTATLVPATVGSVLIRACRLVGDRRASAVTRDDRRQLTHALTAWELPVVGTRGYNYAEVTAGGVTLSEINPRTMESRLCGNLFLVGEVLDVDGRLGGFNFQWAWASARTAARTLSMRRGPSASVAN